MVPMRLAHEQARRLLTYFCIVLEYFLHADSSKQRSWQGPSLFSGGVVPSQRWFHGFAAADKGLYVFGGANGYGENNFSKHLIKSYLNDDLILQENI